VVELRRLELGDLKRPSAVYFICIAGGDP
jgi:hypothetical protein